MNLLVEDWGGKYQCQEISAKKGIGVDELMEKVLLEAEMLDLKAKSDDKLFGRCKTSAPEKPAKQIQTRSVRASCKVITSILRLLNRNTTKLPEV